MVNTFTRHGNHVTVPHGSLRLEAAGGAVTALLPKSCGGTVGKQSAAHTCKKKASFEASGLSTFVCPRSCCSCCPVVLEKYSLAAPPTPEVDNLYKTVVVKGFRAHSSHREMVLSTSLFNMFSMSRNSVFCRGFPAKAREGSAKAPRKHSAPILLQIPISASTLCLLSLSANGRSLSSSCFSFSPGSVGLQEQNKQQLLHENMFFLCFFSLSQICNAVHKIKVAKV